MLMSVRIFMPRQAFGKMESKLETEAGIIAFGEGVRCCGLLEHSDARYKYCCTARQMLTRRCGLLLQALGGREVGQAAGLQLGHETSQAALEGGSLEVAEWLLRAGCPDTGNLLNAAQNGHPDVCECVRTNAPWLSRFSNLPCGDPLMPATGCCRGAANAGYDKIFEWAVRHNLQVVRFPRAQLACIADNFAMLRSMPPEVNAADLNPWMVTYKYDDMQAA